MRKGTDAMGGMAARMAVAAETAATTPIRPEMIDAAIMMTAAMGGTHAQISGLMAPHAAQAETDRLRSEGFEVRAREHGGELDLTISWIGAGARPPTPPPLVDGTVVELTLEDGDGFERATYDADSGRWFTDGDEETGIPTAEIVSWRHVAPSPGATPPGA